MCTEVPARGRRKDHLGAENIDCLEVGHGPGS